MPKRRKMTIEVVFNNGSKEFIKPGGIFRGKDLNGNPLEMVSTHEGAREPGWAWDAKTYAHGVKQVDNAFLIIRSDFRGKFIEPFLRFWDKSRPIY